MVIPEKVVVLRREKARHQRAVLCEQLLRTVRKKSDLACCTALRDRRVRGMFDFVGEE